MKTETNTRDLSPSEIGRMLGSIRSAKKAAASRRNGRKGGRKPAKQLSPASC